MSIGVIQQMLGYCSLQMTLHYAKVSENKLYEKWKETEELGLLNVKANLDAVKVPFGICFKL